MDLQQILNASQAMAKNIVPVVVGPMALVAGLYVVGSSISNLVKMGDHHSGERHTWSEVGIRLLIGALLLQLGATVQSLSNLLFGVGIQDYHNVLGYIPLPAGNGVIWKQVVEIVLLWLVMLGWIAVFRGLMAWHAAASGSGHGNNGDSFWKGVWHIVGGVFAVNLSGAISSFLGK